MNSRCNLCELCQTNKHVKIDGIGSTSAQFVFAEDQPNFDGQEPIGNKQHRMWLVALLDSLGVSVKEIFFTYAVARCFPGLNKGKKKYAGIRTARACRPHLNEELNHIKPKIVFALGQASLRAIFNNNEFKLDAVRGALMDHPAGFKVMPLYSLREIFYDPTLQQSFKTDLGRAFKPELFIGADWGKLNTNPTNEDLGDLLQEALNVGRVASDVETTGLDWYSPQFQVTHYGAYWGDGRGVVFDPRKHQEHYLKFLSVLPQIVHNAGFEGNIYPGTTTIRDDVYLQGWINNPLDSLGLEPLSRKYLGVESWKGKEDDWDSWALRNARDIRCTWDLQQFYAKELNEKQKRLHDVILLPSAIIISGMKRNKIYIDHVVNDELRMKFIREQNKIKQWLGEEHFWWGNPNSSQQVSKFLYGDLGLPIATRARGSGGIDSHSTDKTFLAQLAIDHKEAELIRKYRNFNKMLSTYVNKLRDKEFIRPEIIPVGALSGRTTGKDGVQTYPRRHGIKRQFIPPKGFRWVNGDLKQIELVIIAILSGDKILGDIYRTGGDVHTETCRRIIGEVTKENRSKAKPVNFSLGYGGSAEMLRIIALTDYGIPFTYNEAAGFKSSWFFNYNGVQRWHEEVLRFILCNGYIDSPFGVKYPIGQAFNEEARGAAHRQALNLPCQGTGAFVAYLMLIAANMIAPGRQFLTVHDSVVNGIDIGHEEEFAKLWNEKTNELINDYWPIEDRRGIPISMSTEIGDHLDFE